MSGSSPTVEHGCVQDRFGTKIEYKIEYKS